MKFFYLWKILLPRKENVKTRGKKTKKKNIFNLLNENLSIGKFALSRTGILRNFILRRKISFLDWSSSIIDSAIQFRTIYANISIKIYQ